MKYNSPNEAMEISTGNVSVIIHCILWTKEKKKVCKERERERKGEKRRRQQNKKIKKTFCFLSYLLNINIHCTHTYTVSKRHA